MPTVIREELFRGLPADWVEFLDNDLLDEVLQGLEESKEITPSTQSVFNFARHTPLASIKVVILGQDPYPRAGDAHGLAFSCLTNVPRSLANVYRALLESDLIDSIPTSGNLAYWADQGVLLLNTALTTETGVRGAHMKLWKPYTDDLLKRLSKTPSVVRNNSKSYKIYKIFMLWGNPAKKKAELLDPRCKVLTWVHPSPLNGKQFYSCDHFSRANRMLRSAGPIDWAQSAEESEVEQALEMDGRTAVAFTDGSCSESKRCPEAKASYAGAFVLGRFKDVLLTGSIPNRPNYATNQRGEGYGIWRVLQYAAARLDQWTTLIIITDSEFWMKMFERYMPNWARDDKDFTEKANPDMTVPMWELYCSLVSEMGRAVRFRHMRSHDKDGWSKYNKTSYEYFCYEQNDYVDGCAGWARVNLEPGEDRETLIEYD
jgi:uracil-DNA glycosylase